MNGAPTLGQKPAEGPMPAEQPAVAETRLSDEALAQALVDLNNRFKELHHSFETAPDEAKQWEMANEIYRVLKDYATHYKDALQRHDENLAAKSTTPETPTS